MADITWEAPFSKLDDEKQQVFGWASVTSIDGEPVIDRQSDYISTDDLEESAYEYVLKSRDGGEMHKRRGVSTMIESMVFTPEKIAKLGLPEDFPSGWWVGFQIHDPDVWGEVKKGRYSAFSIHGMGKRREVSLEDILEGEMLSKSEDDTLAEAGDEQNGFPVYEDEVYEIVKNLYGLAEEAAEARYNGEIGNEYDIPVDPQLYEWVDDNLFAKGVNSEDVADYEYSKRGGEFIYIEDALEDIAKAYETGDDEMLGYLSVLFDTDLFGSFEEVGKADDGKSDRRRNLALAAAGGGVAALGGRRYGGRAARGVRSSYRNVKGARRAKAEGLRIGQPADGTSVAPSVKKPVPRSTANDGTFGSGNASPAYSGQKPNRYGTKGEYINPAFPNQKPTRRAG